MNDLSIRDASPEDAGIIADAILEAIGEDIVKSLAGDRSRETVREIFRNLANREDSQYSYLNTRVAVMENGEPAGVCISYDGARLVPLRRAFFKEAVRVLGWDMTEEEMENLPGETSEDEFYLDTLSTVRSYRNKGVATALIRDAYKRASQTGKPLGLLVSDHNPEARKLYEKSGFKTVGRRMFAGEEMTNMRLVRVP